MSVSDPHALMPIRAAGEPLEQAQAALLMLHGRGASADDILSLADELEVDGYALIAPEAAGSTWYPYSFLSPLERNEPALSSALATVRRVLTLVSEAGIPPERTVLLGFSQGACLALEYAARNARRYGGVIAFSGGLIGPDGTPRDYPGSMDGTPVFLGCSDRDPHIPESRVRESAEVFTRLGANVDMRIYERMGHTINGDEITSANALLRGVMAAQ